MDPVLAVFGVGSVGLLDVRFAILPLFGILTGGVYFRRKAEEATAGSGT